MLKIFSFTLLIISFVLISCAKKDDSSSSTPTYTYASAASGATASGSITLGNYSISGTYATACFSSSDSSAPTDATHIGMVAVVTGNDNLTLETNYYTDSTCTADTLSFGSYKNMDNVTDQGALTSGGDVYKISFNQVNQKLLANTTAAKTFFDDLLGMDLTVGTTYVGTTGVTYYNLVKSSGTSIYYGNPSGTTYPTDSPEAEYIKQ